MRLQKLRTCEMTDRELRAYKRKKRRQREFQHRCLMFIMTFCLVIVCAVSYHSIKTSANTGAEQISFKYYANVSVKQGETLWEIADDYIDYTQYRDKNTYIAEVKSINHLDEDGTVKAGQYLIVPYYSFDFR